MKLLSFLGVCTLAALAFQPAQADSGKGKPGYCKDDTECADTYACVSVQTTRDSVENVKQCLPTKSGTPICTGVVAGICPSFSTTWGTSFRQISSVCAYIYPEGKNIKCLTDTSNSTKGGVECLFINDPENKTEPQVGVIYGCVDFDGTRLLFKKNDKSDKLASQFNYSEIITDNCINPKNPSGSTFVCSSQGTCAPKNAGSMDYSCKCNVGFSGKFCEKIVDNKCYNDGVCGGGTCDLATNECTKCPPGTSGNKCALCDPSYDADKVCSKHGKCVASTGDSTLGASNSSRLLAAATYQCQCDTGYSDVHCAVKIKAPPKTSSPNASPSPADKSMSAATVSASIAAVALTIAAVFSA